MGTRMVTDDRKVGTRRPNVTRMVTDDGVRLISHVRVCAMDCAARV